MCVCFYFLSVDSLGFAAGSKPSPLLHSFLEQSESCRSSQPSTTTGTRIPLPGRHTHETLMGGVHLLWTDSYLFPIMSNGWVDKCAIWWVCVWEFRCAGEDQCVRCIACIFAQGVCFCLVSCFTAHVRERGNPVDTSCSGSRDTVCIVCV